MISSPINAIASSYFCLMLWASVMAFLILPTSVAGLSFRSSSSLCCIRISVTVFVLPSIIDARSSDLPAFAGRPRGLPRLFLVVEPGGRPGPLFFLLLLPGGLPGPRFFFPLLPFLAGLPGAFFPLPGGRPRFFFDVFFLATDCS